MVTFMHTYIFIKNEYLPCILALIVQQLNCHLFINSFISEDFDSIDSFPKNVSKPKINLFL